MLPEGCDGVPSGSSWRSHGSLRMEHIDLLEVISQILPFIGAKNPQGKTDQCPHMNHRIISPVMFTEFMDLGMAVMAAGNAIVRTSGFNLIIFEFAVFQTLFFESGLEKSPAAAAAIVVGAVGLHVNEIFFPYNGFHDKS